ncbi:nucleotidyltransferase family protein [Bosea sp. (in: a-proteobacteria)]|jgi:predicted nucleotidyltransferase|uniref:nucleotidyltransferase family protein n=1 Tax=Bosea sp. (in: a-proteobacteria) TaxID=1871050 RepID=UPI00226CF56B|nr:nucleotidyltransferase family protein [Bosea sp. (in: a-proteobacteria)]
MTRDEATTELARHADALRARGAQAAFLFGSTARGESRDDSDLDVFIDVVPGRKFSLIDLAGMHAFLVDALGIEIDLTTRNSLHPKLRDQIESEAIRIF